MHERMTWLQSHQSVLSLTPYEHELIFQHYYDDREPQYR